MTDPKSFSWLKDSPQLLLAVMKFNQPSIDSIHIERQPAWLQRAPIASLEQTRRGRRRLVGCLANWAGFQTTGFYDFQPWYRRVTLLPICELEQLALYLGTELISTRIAKLIRRVDIEEAKRQLGERLYHFALERSAWPNLSQDETTPNSEIRKDDLSLLGWQTLASSFSAEPYALRERFGLKLPSSVSVEPGVHQSKGLDKTVRRIIITELQTEMAPCFT
ncbi:SctK family type III secretion system sorting platform protein [Bremerella sp. JC770]|uniref:SctK family type III secretion system sorting platform protein n=1 Tax=Bremerella sp. JC770 TaxID=3232137 RepID=UPI0034586731